MFTIACLGDSITCEWDEPKYPTFWQQQLDQSRGPNQVRILSAGINGETASDGLCRLDRDVLTYHPDLVTVMFGHNDIYFGIPPHEFTQTLDYLLQALTRSAIKHVWLLTPNQVWGPANQAPYTPYLTALRILAQSTHTPLIDLWSNAFTGHHLDNIYDYFTNTTDPATRDWVHPNELGHRLLADYLMQQFVAFRSRI